jgi:hypothetical protein
MQLSGSGLIGEFLAARYFATFTPETVSRLVLDVS